MRRIVPVLTYFGLELALCLALSFYSVEAAASLYWTVWQGESAYFAWHTFFGFHPLRGYLAVVLSAATFRLLAMWLVLFYGSKPPLDHPWVKNIFNPERFPGLWAQVRKEKSRRFIFSTGLVPGIWWLGYLALRQSPMEWGVATVVLGNIVKLTLFALVFSLGRGHLVAYFAIGAFVFASFLPRLVERLSGQVRLARYRPL